MPARHIVAIGGSDAGISAALRIRDFRLLWVGSLFAFMAFFMSTVVQSVVAFDLTGNNSSVGVVVFSQGVAQTLLGPIGGAMADRAEGSGGNVGDRVKLNQGVRHQVAPVSDVA